MEIFLSNLCDQCHITANREHAMVQNPVTLRYARQFTLIIVSTLIGAAIFITTAVAPARAQAFADAKMALVDYSRADLAPTLRRAG
jgi:hypothetical protein